MSEHHPAAPREHSPGYETTDVRIRPIAWFIIGLTAFILLLLPILFWLFWLFDRRAERADPVLTPLLQTDQIPPPPRLQATPLRDYEDFLASEEQLLNSYGWIDREQEIVRLPIARAVDLLAERGLPVPQGETSPQAQPAQPEGQNGDEPRALDSDDKTERAPASPGDQATPRPPGESTRNHGARPGEGRPGRPRD